MPPAEVRDFVPWYNQVFVHRYVFISSEFSTFFNDGVLRPEIQETCGETANKTAAIAVPATAKRYI
jgi:hypothetical protein